MHATRVEHCLHCGCPCAVDTPGDTAVAIALRSACQHGMCGCHQLAEQAAGTRGQLKVRPRLR